MRLLRLTGKSLATLPQFEPVRSASGLSTPHPSGNTLFRNAILTRLRRGDCARHLSSTDSRDGGPLMPLPRPVLRYRLSAPRLAPAPPPIASLRNGQKHPELRPVPPFRWGASKKAVTPPAFRRQPE